MRANKLAAAALILFGLIVVIEFVGYVSGQKQLRRQVHETGLVLVSLEKQAKTAAQTHAALCTFRGTLADGVRSDRVLLKRSRRFLRTHPDGLPSLGFTYAQLKKSVDDQAALLARRSASLAALGSLRCVRADDQTSPTRR